MPTVSASLLPTLIEDAPLAGSTCVVIDILRASTTIVHALENGARAVIPCLTVEDALVASQRFRRNEFLLGGERGGELIEGFDLDNSPFGYSEDAVRSKTVIFTTTNGTRALWSAQAAQEIIIGAFVNRAAVVEYLSAAEQNVHLICAGTNGQLTAEDVLFAGAIVHDLVNIPGMRWQEGNLQAELVHDYFQSRANTPERFRQEFLESLGAQNLMKLNMQRDIERCLQNDLFSGVPVWNATTGELTLHRSKAE